MHDIRVSELSCDFCGGKVETQQGQFPAIFLIDVAGSIADVLTHPPTYLPFSTPTSISSCPRISINDWDFTYRIELFRGGFRADVY